VLDGACASAEAFSFYTCRRYGTSTVNLLARRYIVSSYRDRVVLFLALS